LAAFDMAAGERLHARRGAILTFSVKSARLAVTCLSK
jgi:hypothetical protein